VRIKRFLGYCIIIIIAFCLGIVMGKYFLSRQVHITVVDINKLVDIIERYNEAKYDLERMKEWNDEAVIKPPEEEREANSRHGRLNGGSIK